MSLCLCVSLFPPPKEVNFLLSHTTRNLGSMKLFALLLMGAFLPPHAFYLSVQEIQYDPQRQMLEVQYKVFTDDLEDGIRAFEGQPIVLQDGINTGEQLRIERYIAHKSKIFLNGQSISLTLQASENQGDASFIRFTGPVPNEPSAIRIHSTLLTEIFATQRNVVRYRNGAFQRMLTLSKGAPEGSLQIQ